MERAATTPFGGGRMSGRVLARQARIGERQAELRQSEGTNSSGRADKWQLLRALTEARAVYGLGDRTICLLEALVSFTTERELDGREPVIVFPSNRELAFRARGMAPATIRRHLACLVDAGMIFRRDSANGKRYCRRDETGEVEDAFGFDLAPFVLKADEIYSAAESARAEAKRFRALRGEVTVLSRDISKIITLALEEGRAGKWESYLLRYQTFCKTRIRMKFSSDMQTLAQELRELLSQVENDYLSSLSEEEMSGNERQYERHQQNSKSKLQFDKNGYEHNTAESASPPLDQRRLAVSLKRLKTLCPQINDYVKDGISEWNDLIRAADTVRTMLGISPDAWLKAKQTMGEQAAAITVAVMLERAEAIRSAGGYLRTLTDKAEQGQFSVYPMLQALEKNLPQGKS
ncbi:replication initiation protein [Agrobacterium vitis]|uniref:Replication initiation protein n=1 Tax=Agrobacterium vitis TaxID=373 RepID=A0A368NZP5_AGRVI|nr:plasmid replication protein RepC [Agrobacterium vitis]KAA3510707.1 replication initiation protein [Agrobacterium vitis]KAA3527967.1 replication initiation protein [Agrobacterium vitis]MUZ96675.1 replication initiation protein [Agrobacterium vitis]MVA28472.1 replication initiation protein [Agrobacterium vitis]NOJ37138.1 replication initiation protein RepC [Agrobacterium vitis]